MMTIISGIILGVGLAAAAGFRVFLPLLALSIAAKTGFLPINESWEWVGSNGALITLGIASFFEIVAYYIPWLDNLLDTAAIPLAAIAGTAMVAATAAGLDPIVTWSLAIIAGGGTAGAIKSAAAGTRLMSSTVTAGIGNPIVSTVETGFSILLSILAILIPVVAIVLVLVILYFVFKAMLKLKPKSA